MITYWSSAPTAPTESRHALNLRELDTPSVHLWVARDGEKIIGMVALADLELGHLELKSMRTDPARRGQGVASALLSYALEQAQTLGAKRISLETGSMDFFVPARNLYHKYGFTECLPFGTYQLDPNSVFLTLSLSAPYV